MPELVPFDPVTGQTWPGFFRSDLAAKPCFEKGYLDRREAAVLVFEKLLFFRPGEPRTRWAIETLKAILAEFAAM